MLIGLDGNEANVTNRVGSNIYALQILKNIWKVQSSKLKAQKGDSFGMGNLKFKIYLKERPLTDLPSENDWWQYRVLKPKFLWTQWRLPLELIWEREKPDVFFTPGHYAPRFCPIPLVISIMDLAFLRFPKQFRKNDLYQLINWTKYSVKKASHILTISEFTKKEIVHFYKISEGKITVTYPGISNLKSPWPPWPPWPLAGRLAGRLSGRQISKPKLKYQIFNKFKIKDKYFLYIGTLQPRKNLICLIKAFKKLITNYSLLITQLVIVGKKGWMYEEIFKKVQKLGLKDKVIFTDYINEEEKYILLKNALAFVLPSLYEGFGIPVLEAMQAKCPVIISRTSSLPEVGGEAALYINNPYSSDFIYQTMVKMVKLGGRKRKDLIEKGFEQVKKFSWEETAKKTLEILKKIGG